MKRVLDLVVDFERCLWRSLFPQLQQSVAMIPWVADAEPGPMPADPHGGLKDSDGILWAVPVRRRSVERRMMRRYGAENWPTGRKLLRPKANLLVCNACGHYHEAGRLCPNCYERVKEETKEIQKRMVEEWGLDPVDKDVIVLYDSEKPDKSSTPEKQRVIEMKKKRPTWFSQNLLQKANAEPVNERTKTITPKGLG